MSSILTAIVSGANRGIGREISLSLAAEGYKTLLFGRNESELEDVSNEISIKYPLSIKPEIYICDLNDTDKLTSLLDEIVENNTSIDVLVNNAGIYKSGSHENTLADFENILSINLSAPFIFLKKIIPQMKSQQSGYIFNVASRAGKIGFEQSGLYSSSKFALVGLSESIYRELSKFNIKVTALCPSFVNTEMAINASAPMEPKEMIQVEDLSNTIKYLLKLSKNAYVRELWIDSRLAII